MHYSLAPARGKAHHMLLECLAQYFREECSFRNDDDRLHGKQAICKR